MDAPFFNPMMPAGVPAAQTAGRAANLGGDQDFAKYMHRRLAEESDRKDLLGVASRASAAPRAAQPAKKSEAPGEEAVPAVAGLLQEFMQKLQALSSEPENGPGAWSFAPPDAGLLRQLATDAGMEGAEIAGLLDQLEQEGELPLGELFAALARHFAQLAQPAPVTAPETDLPLLESILSRLGVPVDQLQQIETQAVVADGKLDLGKFLQALEGLPNKELGPPVLLSDAEADQLQAMLSAAGVTQELQQSMFPERGLSWDRAFQPEGPVHMGLGRLESMLRQAIGQVEAGRPQADLPAFFADLDQVLTQSGFNGSGTGWSPAVQETVQGMYQELLASVDLAGARIEGPPAKPKLGLPAAQATPGGEEQEGEEGLFAVSGEEGEVDSLRNLAVPGSGAEGSGAEKGEAGNALAAAGKKMQGGESPAGAETFSLADGKLEISPRAEAAAKTIPGPRLAPEVQQQTFDQLTAGVARGLRSNEQHFVLRLHPKELGEVKVEVLVRDQQISLAFTMEDKRVKEVLESNMGQFRDNLEKQGMVLGECMVSVDQQESSGEAWQRFVQDWQEQQSKGRGVEKAGGDPQELLTRTFGQPGRENAFNIVI